MQIPPLNTLSATLCNKLEMKNDSPCWLDLQERGTQQTNKQTKSRRLHGTAVQKGTTHLSALFYK